MGPCVKGKKYILILRDNHSSYVWLSTAETTKRKEAADAIINWIGAFGCMKWPSSNQGSHFKNKLIRVLTEELHVQHYLRQYIHPGPTGPCKGYVERCLVHARMCALNGSWIPKTCCQW